MPFDREQPGPYKRGDSIPGAGEFNRIVRGGRRQISGPNVSEYGDRVVVNPPRDYSTNPHNSTFLQKFVVLAVYDNYLLCKVITYAVDASGWWAPYNYQAVGGEPSYDYIHIAKPDEIRRSFWDGKTINVNGEMIAYAHVSEGIRTANGVTETLTQPYYPGCVINGVKGVSGVNDDQDRPILWTDANTAGRHWHRSDTGVFVLIQDASTETLGDTDTDPACPMSSGVIVTPYNDCTLDQGIEVLVIPLKPGLFRDGYVYRAWPVGDPADTDTTTDTDTSTDLIPIYAADPDRGEPCVKTRVEDICVFKTAGVVTDIWKLVVVTQGCDELSRQWLPAEPCVDDTDTETDTTPDPMACLCGEDLPETIPACAVINFSSPIRFRGQNVSQISIAGTAVKSGYSYSLSDDMFLGGSGPNDEEGWVITVAGTVTCNPLAPWLGHTITYNSVNYNGPTFNEFAFSGGGESGPATVTCDPFCASGTSDSFPNTDPGATSGPASATLALTFGECAAGCQNIPDTDTDTVSEIPCTELTFCVTVSETTGCLIAHSGSHNVPGDGYIYSSSTPGGFIGFVNNGDGTGEAFIECEGVGIFSTGPIAVDCDTGWGPVNMSAVDGSCTIQGVPGECV
jgi:hypothetical protein